MDAFYLQLDFSLNQRNTTYKYILYSKRNKQEKTPKIFTYNLSLQYVDVEQSIFVFVFVFLIQLSIKMKRVALRLVLAQGQ